MTFANSSDLLPMTTISAKSTSPSI